MHGLATSTIKRGWCIKINWMPKFSEIATKNTHPFSHKTLLSQAKISKIGSSTFGPTDFHPRHNLAKPYHFDTTDSALLLPSLGGQHSVARYTKSKLPILCIGAIKFFHMTITHLFGSTKLCISVPPRFKSCYLLSKSVPPSL